MQANIKLGIVAVLSSLMIACGAKTEEKGTDLASRKKELENLRQQEANLAEQIRRLEDTIAKQDPSASVKAKLVETSSVTTSPFSHYIDLQGKVTTENIYTVTPRGQGGQVKAVYVKEGDRVNKGQLLMKLDDAVVRQQIEQAKIQLAYAQDIYQRRKNLWDQNIGSEVDLITARNNVNNLQKQIDILNEQLSFTNVYADVSGIVETVTIRVGELFNGNPMAGITIINAGSLKVAVDIPENYLGQIHQGALVKIDIPDINKSFEASVSRISQVINSNSRGFTAEMKIPGEPNLKPNQLAMVHIRDYNTNKAIVIPLTTIQTDDKGKFVFVMVNENGRKLARKRHIEVGQIYGEQIEVKDGLKEGEQLVTAGYQSLYDGQPLETSATQAGNTQK